MDKKPLILIVNDDGFEAAGLYALAEAARGYGEIVVISPDSPRSGMGHAITMNVPLRIKEYKREEGIIYYRTNGTPADCVKLGQKVILKNRKIDLVLSGINHGSNSSVSLLYSGTMAAAIEASFDNIPAVGISLLDYRENADFSAAIEISRELIGKIITHPFPDHIALNVNIPKCPLEDIQGVKITHQALGTWKEEFEERKDIFGNNYYWLKGHLETNDNSEESCQWSLDHNYVSIQPVQFDLTAYRHIQTFKFLEK